ncbi:MAG: DUF4852 domain-containing protein [Alphaproteobacteria bacterium]|nr:DUF4852 domain-containing protein [Alphaproteobacteria bacterium]
MNKVTFIAASISLLLLTVFLCHSITGLGRAEAKEIDYDALLESYTGKYIQSDDNHKITSSTGEYEAPRSYIYEEPTVKTFSYMFWALGLYRLEDDKAIDEYMRINECEIYKNYSSGELEWKKIKDATREFIRENKEDFPTRFEFVMHLKLASYDEERQAFEVQDEFKIESLRRFEFYAKDFTLAPCSADHKIGKGYPRTIVLEFSRPFNLVHVPMHHNIAVDYMNRKLDAFYDRFGETSNRTRTKMLSFRDAYLVLKVKVFSYGKMLGTNKYGYNSVQMMGVLEGFEIFETKDKERLFYAQNYVTSQSKGKLDKHLKAQYELLLRKHKGEGLFH